MVPKPNQKTSNLTKLTFPSSAKTPLLSVSMVITEAFSKFNHTGFTLLSWNLQLRSSLNFLYKQPNGSTNCTVF